MLVVFGDVVGEVTKLERSPAHSAGAELSCETGTTKPTTKTTPGGRPEGRPLVHLTVYTERGGVVDVGECCCSVLVDV